MIHKILSIVFISVITTGTAKVLYAQIGIGAPVPSGAMILFDGTRKSLHENWQYWEGPRFSATPPIKWQIVEDPVNEGYVLNCMIRQLQGDFMVLQIS